MISEQSTQEAENQEAETKLLSLSELTVECPLCVGRGWVVVSSSPAMPEHGTLEQEGCSNGQGTGQVAKYEALRQSVHETGSSCLPGCRGWLPVSREKAAQFILDMDEFDTLGQDGQGGYTCWLCQDPEVWRASTQDWRDATIAALWKMEQPR